MMLDKKVGYIVRNSGGVKEIREGNVRPLWDLSNYGVRHSMGALEWGYYWADKMAWETAKIIPVFPGVYFAFGEDEKTEYEMFGEWAIPAGFNIASLEPKKEVSASQRSMRYERLLYPMDGGYKARRNGKDGGL